MLGGGQTGTDMELFGHAKQGGDYAMALKGSQGALRDDVQLFLDDPATPLPQDTQVSKGHGCIGTRIASVSSDVA